MADEFDPADPRFTILRWVASGADPLAGQVEVRHARPAVQPHFVGPVKFALAERVLADLGDGTFGEDGREPWPSLAAAIADFRHKVRMALLDRSGGVAKGL